MFVNVQNKNVIVTNRATLINELNNVAKYLSETSVTDEKNGWCKISTQYKCGDECYICLWIDGISQQAITKEQLNDTYYNDIEGFLFFNRSTTSGVIQNLCAKNNNNTHIILSELLDVILDQAKKKYNTVFGVVNLNNPLFGNIVQLYLNNNFASPCFYNDCKNLPFNYEYPFIGLIWVKTQVNIDINKTENTIRYLTASYNKFKKEPTQKCMKGYKLERFLSEGGYGVVSQVCGVDGNCKYVIKLQDIRNQSQRERWEKEMELTKELSVKYNIGPKFIKTAWTCDEGIGAYVAELWSGELKQGACLPRHLIDKLQTQISQLHKMYELPKGSQPGTFPQPDDYLVDGDIFEKNVLVKKDSQGNIIDVTLNDFGVVKPIREWKNTSYYDEQQNKYRTILDMWFNDYVAKHGYIMEYYNDHHYTFKDVWHNPKIMDYAMIYYIKKHCRI